MVEYFNKMTPNGLLQIQNEIERLKKDRPKKIKRLSEAAALGDRSENAEYTTSKKELRHLESRLDYFRKQEQYAEVVRPSTDNLISIGKSTTVEFLEDNSTETFQIVGKQEAEMSELEDNKIFYNSPIGLALIEHGINEIVTVNAPSFSYQLKIKEIKK
ncbi:transcription elongation factor GreA [Lactobacillus sp. S2-2]|uniref:transcription elongation factor GreA n=1 Tax=Lactobacillus sp. S2-2 TaxID=2692917 RepID=UPI001F018209|nr:transcription elongation factor GreA [Lactobacillus sp. S2-2]MCF6514617.1 transcription elongation factor GreA [Lactobacillus sp. S2-2]